MAFSTSPVLIVQAFVGIIGMIGNFLVCLVIQRDKAMHTLTNAFIFNQATVDFLGSVIMFLRSAITVPYPLPSGTPGILICRIWISNYFLWSFYIVSSFNLLALTFERYLAIVYPLKFHTFCDRSGAIILIATVWVSGFAVGTYAVMLFRYKDTNCTPDFNLGIQVLGVALPGLVFFIPVVSMLFAYIHIMLELKRSAKRLERMGASVSAPGNPNHETADEALLRARRNTFKTLVLVFAAFVCCWSLNASMILAANLGAPYDDNSALYIISVALVAANSAINPAIYAFKYKQFQVGFKKLFCGGRTAAVMPDANLPLNQARTTDVAA